MNHNCDCRAPASGSANNFSLLVFPIPLATEEAFSPAGGDREPGGLGAHLPSSQAGRIQQCCCQGGGEGLGCWQCTITGEADLYVV